MSALEIFKLCAFVLTVATVGSIVGTFVQVRYEHRRVWRRR